MKDGSLGEPRAYQVLQYDERCLERTYLEVPDLLKSETT